MARDVDLVIRAKDQAKKAINSVADALQELTDVQQDVGQSAAKTDGLLGKLRDELSKLDKEARGLAALNKVAGQLDRAAAAVGRLDAATNRAVADQEKLAASSREAAANTERLRKAAEDAKAAYDKQRAAVSALTAEQKKDASVAAAARQSREALKTTLTEANAALREAQKHEGLLARQLVDATAAAERQSAALVEANSELAEIASMANKASASLGGVEATQEAVAAASARAAADMDRLNAALVRQVGGGTSRAVPTTAAGAAGAYREQIAAVNQAKVAWREAQEEANKLGAAIARSEQPTREMQTAFLLAQKASKDAKEEYLAQGAALNQLRGNLQQARAATAQMAQAETQAATAAATATAGTRQYAGASQAAAAASSKQAAEQARVRDAFAGIYGESRKSMNLFQRLRGEILSLTAAYVGFYAAISAAGAVVTAMRSIEQAQNRLGVAFNQNQAVVGAEMAWLEGEASRLKLSFADLASEYGKFAFSAKGAGLGLEDIHTVFLGVAEGARVMGLNIDETRGILKALDQIMSKGKVQAEELRGQLGDRLSGSFRLFADAIGVTTAELDKMLEAGEVVANRSQMVAFGQQLRDTFGPQLAQALESTTAEISDFDANLKNAARQVGEGGFWDALGESLGRLNEWFKSSEGEEFFTSLGVALGKIISIIPALVDNFGLLVTMFQIFTALKVAEVFTTLFTTATGKIGPFSAVMRTARADVMAFALSLQMMGATARSAAIGTTLTSLSGVIVGMRGALIAGAAAFRVFWAAVGGWPTVIISVLTFIAQHLLGKWLTSVDSATTALQKHNEMIEKVRTGYVEAKGDAEKWAKAIEGVTFVELRESAEEATRAFAELKDTALQQYFDEVTIGLDMFTRTQRDILKPTIDAFREGSISAEEFRNRIDELAKANPDLDRNLVKALIDTANKSVEAERRIKEVAAAIRAKGGAASEADKKLLALADSLEQVNASADPSAIDRYAAAMKKLGESIPDVKAQMDLDAARAAIEATYQSELKALTENGVGPYGADPGIAKKIADLTAQRDRALEALVATTIGGGAAYRDKVIGRESGGNPSARTSVPGQTASGLYGFTDGTFIAMFKQTSLYTKGMTDAAILAFKSNEDVSAKLFDLLTQKNAERLVSGGFAATDTNKYLAHFLGIGDALKVLAAAPGTPLAGLINQGSINANKSILEGKTAGDVISFASRKMGASSAEVEVQQTVNDLLAEAAKKQAELNAEVATGISQRAFEIEQMGRSTTEQAVQAELRRLETQAMQAGLPVLENGSRLTAEQTSEVRASVEARVAADDAQKRLNETDRLALELAEARGVVESRNDYINRVAKERGIDLTAVENSNLVVMLGLLYDINEAKRQGQQLDNVVTGLGGQQSALMEQIEFYQNMGDQGAVDALKKKLDEVNAAYLQALIAARDFWATQDPTTNPQAAAAVLQYDALIAKQRALGQQAIITGKQINDTLANGLSQAFDRFAQSIADGANAFESARDAFLSFAADFLRQIAQMIIQAVILQIVSGGAPGGGGGIGGSIANWINGAVRHNGGMVGSGGGHRSVWAGAFANATRYHGGGLVGFKPNEVPIIAERGEEVLDMGDPRHRNNLGAGAAASLNFKAVNVLDGPSLAEAIFSDEAGEQVVVNYFRANSRKLQSILAGG